MTIRPVKRVVECNQRIPIKSTLEIGILRIPFADITRITSTNMRKNENQVKVNEKHLVEKAHSCVLEIDLKRLVQTENFKKLKDHNPSRNNRVVDL